MLSTAFSLGGRREMQVAAGPPQGGPGRSRVSHTSSSPIKAADCEDVPLVEMTQRMKKRARQSISRPQRLRQFLKRPKNTHAVAPSICSSSVSILDSLISLNDGTNNTQYQTPFNLSPVSSPTAPDPMSPVPSSRLNRSRTGSRNLRENKNVKPCSKSGSGTNSPKKKVKRPPFYIKTRTRSEANAHPGENVDDEVLFPVSGSLPTLGSMKAAVCGPHLADSSTAYMLQDLSGQDWLRPAKVLSRSPFPEDYIPPGTPFQEWDYSSETFLGGVPLQTSTPYVVKDFVRKHMSTNAAFSAPKTLNPTHTSDDAINNTVISSNAEGFESCNHVRQHIAHDSIFSFDASTALSTSVLRSNCMSMGDTLQDGPMLSTVTFLPDPGQAVVNLSGMLDGLDISLDIDGGKNRSPSLVQRSRSLDNPQNTTIPGPQFSAQQAASKRRDRASTIRASDYMIKPVISVPSDGETSTSVAALTTRTRSGTIRPSCAGQRQTRSGTSYNPLTLVGSDKKLSGSPSSSQSKVVQMSRVSGAPDTESMVIDVHSDESDDELLLDRKGWNWDGRWD
ncbi:hypothetical protein BJV74DRAFT_842833 [Russula compacta]|nr:hypothetical protein BJV74DRAFT_842833 [Russula compacta]